MVFQLHLFAWHAKSIESHHHNLHEISMNYIIRQAVLAVSVRAPKQIEFNQAKPTTKLCIEAYIIN